MTFWWTSWLDVIIVHRMALPTSLGISESTDNIVVEGACSHTHTHTSLSFPKNVEIKKEKIFVALIQEVASLVTKRADYVELVQLGSVSGLQQFFPRHKVNERVSDR